MKHTIKSIILLAAILIGGAGQAWASLSTEPNLGKIVYTESANDHGSLAFYKEKACTNHINTTPDGVYSFGLTSVTVKDGSGETVIGYKVYIKATPDFGYTLEAGDEEGKVSFIKAEVTVAGTDVAGARTRGAAPTVNVGDFIDVTATDTKGVYCVTMPADKNLNLHITATFPENEPISVSYYDPTAEGDNKTKTVFATPLTGNETTLDAGWYVVNEDINYATYSSANCYLQLNGEVHLILADGKKMTVGKSDNPGEKVGIVGRSYSLTIYGQGGDAEGSLEVYTAKTVYSINLDAVTICGGNVITSQGVTVNEFNIYGGSFEDKQVVESPSALLDAINARVVNIYDGKVKSGAEIYVDASTGESNITINGGEIEVYCLRSIKGGVTINGGQVTLTAPGNAIESNTNITLGWQKASDFIKAAGSYTWKQDGTLSIADGQRFIAYTPGATESDPMTATAVISGASGTDFDLSAIEGKMLKPALKITLPEGVTATGMDVVTDEIAGTYAIYDVPVTLDGTYYTASEGYNLSGFTVKDADDKELSIDNGNEFTMPATAVTVTPTETAIPATDPTITAQPSDLPSDLGKLEWGDTSGNELSIEVQEVEVHTLSYQWYSNSTNSNTDGTAIDGATSASYAVSTEHTGTFYYYCIVTATRNDNNETASVSSDVATVTVSPKSYDFSTNTISCAITQDENGYSVHLTEGEGSANQLPVSGTVADLDYSRTLTAPTESNKDVTIGNEPANLYTVCLPFTPDTGTGVTYYTLSKVEGTTLSFVEISGSPVAFTPYLVAVTGNNNFTEDCSNVNFETTATIHSTTVNGYTFTGTLTGLTNTDAQGKYILQADNKWGKVTSENTDARIPPFRAYIEGPANGARLLNSSFDGDATGIQNIRTVDADGTEQWYDLNGRRIAKPTTKGVYIRNGKKTTN